MVLLQGGNGAMVNRQVQQLAHCSVLIYDPRIFPERFVRMLCEECACSGNSCSFVTSAKKALTYTAQMFLLMGFLV